MVSCFGASLFSLLLVFGRGLAGIFRVGGAVFVFDGIATTNAGDGTLAGAESSGNDGHA